MNVFLYPKVDYQANESPNPYIHDFELAIRQHNTISNKGLLKTGVFELFSHLTRSDIYIFHWIENLKNKRFGKIQVLFFVAFLHLSKVLGKKKVFVLHNKYAHDTKKNFWTDLTFHLMMKHGDLILTHSKEGIAFGKQYFPQYAHKIKYFVHPIKSPLQPTARTSKQYDLLIWGSIYPYKGILEFLQFIKKQSPNYKILILGRCFDTAYKKKLEACLTDQIHFEDKFLSIEELAKLAGQTKFILFTYHAKSVLSSGSLMDSIRMGATVLGPECGAFKDLKAYPFIQTYEHFEDILEKIKSYDQLEKGTAEELTAFCKQNNWEAFAQKLHLELKKLTAEDLVLSASKS